MYKVGPSLEQLQRHLIAIPQEFLAEPKISGRGDIVVYAVISDLFRLHALPPLTVKELVAFDSDKLTERNRLTVAVIACWLLSEPWFISNLSASSAKQTAQSTRSTLLKFLTEGVDTLARHVKSSKFVSDSERREELIRSALAAFDICPEGESEVQASDRLTTISTIERQRVISESIAAKQRAAAVLAALQRKAAQESADKWGRE